MFVSPPLPVEIVSQATQLDAATKAMLGSSCIALDTESNSFHRYPEQLCLIQISTRHRVYIIDAIDLKKMAALQEVLDACIIKVIHGADYDICSTLDRKNGSYTALNVTRIATIIASPAMP
jgi:ribonuclease D